jgi:rare lipoprotein A
MRNWGTRMCNTFQHTAFVAAISMISLASVADAKGRSADTQSGIASVYSVSSGSRTASGGRLNPGALTAAHRSLPFGTEAIVTNQHNGRSVIVIINDRGPFVRGRIIDLTPAAARAIGFSGLAPVTVDVNN